MSNSCSNMEMSITENIQFFLLSTTIGCHVPINIIGPCACLLQCFLKSLFLSAFLK